MSKFKLVPMEPTPEMMNALTRVASYAASWEQGYKAMLEAAPEQPVQEPVAWGNFTDDGRLVGLSQHPEDQTTWQGKKPLFASPHDTYALLRKALEALETAVSGLDQYTRQIALSDPKHPLLHSITAIRKHLGEE